MRWSQRVWLCRDAECPASTSEPDPAPRWTAARLGGRLRLGTMRGAHGEKEREAHEDEHRRTDERGAIGAGRVDEQAGDECSDRLRERPHRGRETAHLP